MIRVEWSVAALADLDRFAAFLHERHPELAARAGGEIIRKVEALAQHPLLGRPVSGRAEYRQAVLRVLNADYVFQYRIDGERIVLLRVFHGREARDKTGDTR